MVGSEDRRGMIVFMAQKSHDIGSVDNRSKQGRVWEQEQPTEMTARTQMMGEDRIPETC